MDCFHDFCLACDKQCTDGPYCSQTCRLADLEKGNTSAPSSPSNISHFSQSSWSKSTYAPRIPARTQTSYSVKIDTGRKLTPSSSQSSLTSTTSTMTEQARLELQDYFSSFDQTRAAKRRSSVR